MTHSTFTLTVALEDDNGTTYSASDVTRRLLGICADAYCDVFSVATGHGIDTDTNAHEPIVILQGSGPTDYVHQVGNDAAHFARTILHQRAIGWYATTDDTYRDTAPKISNRDLLEGLSR